MAATKDERGNGKWRYQKVDVNPITGSRRFLADGSDAYNYRTKFGAQPAGTDIYSHERLVALIRSTKDLDGKDTLLFRNLWTLQTACTAYGLFRFYPNPRTKNLDVDRVNIPQHLYSKKIDAWLQDYGYKFFVDYLVKTSRTISHEEIVKRLQTEVPKELLVPEYYEEQARIEKQGKKMFDIDDIDISKIIKK